MTEWALLVRLIVVVSTVDEVCDAANSALHNQSNATYCYRWRGVVSLCVYIMGIITAKTAELIDMLNGSDCPA